jgi:hypothetical protein
VNERDGNTLEKTFQLPELLGILPEVQCTNIPLLQNSKSGRLKVVEV